MKLLLVLAVTLTLIFAVEENEEHDDDIPEEDPIKFDSDLTGEQVMEILHDYNKYENTLFIIALRDSA